MYPACARSPATDNARNPIYGYRSNYPVNSSSFSRTHTEARGNNPPEEIYRSNYNGFRYIHRAGGGCYRPRRFMDAEKANFMQNTSNDPPPLPEKQLTFETPKTDKLGRPFTENQYSKWIEHPRYRTTNRMALCRPHDREKYEYYGRTGDFTAGFLGNTYRNVSLSTAISESSVHDFEMFS